MYALSLTHHSSWYTHFPWASLPSIWSWLAIHAWEAVIAGQPRVARISFQPDGSFWSRLASYDASALVPKHALHAFHSLNYKDDDDFDDDLKTLKGCEKNPTKLCHNMKD